MSELSREKIFEVVFSASGWPEKSHVITDRIMALIEANAPRVMTWKQIDQGWMQNSKHAGLSEYVMSILPVTIIADPPPAPVEPDWTVVDAEEWLDKTLGPDRWWVKRENGSWHVWHMHDASKASADMNYAICAIASAVWRRQNGVGE